MNKIVTIAAGKAARKASMLVGKRGSNIPGVVCRKIDRNILIKLSQQVDKVIFISGTNGKTTTSQMVAHILRANGKSIIHNGEGANMITGITSSFVFYQNFLGNRKADYAVIEIDEGSIKKVTKELVPDYMVVTNFFRDQLDRFGEIDILINTIKNTIQDLKTRLILNGDDPFVHRLGFKRDNTVYYGIKEDAFSFDQHEMSESKFCPVCNQILNYNHVHYSQLGHYECECGFKRPDMQYELEEITIDHDVSITIEGAKMPIGIYGSYNALNALAAYSVCRELGFTKEQIAKGFSTLKIENGRMEMFPFADKKIILNLAKNPAGINVSLSEANYLNSDKQFVFMINDFVNDGHDISWLWDADFEKIANEQAVRVICSGTRAEDMAVRMKYAGIPEDRIVVLPAIQDAVRAINEQVLDTFVVTNYTPLFETQQLLSKQFKDETNHVNVRSRDY